MKIVFTILSTSEGCRLPMWASHLRHAHKPQATLNTSRKQQKANEITLKGQRPDRAAESHKA